MTREEFSKIAAIWYAMGQIEQLLDKEFLVKAVIPMEKHRCISIFEYEDVSLELKAKVQQILDSAQHEVMSVLRQEHIRLANEFCEIKVEVKPTSSDHE